jgi:hypothetical protein
VLPKEEREAAVRDLEDALHCPGPWGADLSRRVLRMLRSDDAPDVPEVAVRLHPDTLEEAAALRMHGSRRLCDLADFRAGMLRDLR